MVVDTLIFLNCKLFVGNLNHSCPFHMCSTYQTVQLRGLDFHKEGFVCLTSILESIGHEACTKASLQAGGPGAGV